MKMLIMNQLGVCIMLILVHFGAALYAHATKPSAFLEYSCYFVAGGYGAYAIFLGIRALRYLI